MSEVLTAGDLLEILASHRCPCGHLKGDHEEPSGEWPEHMGTEVMGDCRECDCKGLVEGLDGNEDSDG